MLTTFKNAMNFTRVDLRQGHHQSPPSAWQTERLPPGWSAARCWRRWRKPRGPAATLTGPQPGFLGRSDLIWWCCCRFDDFWISIIDHDRQFIIFDVVVDCWWICNIYRWYCLLWSDDALDLYDLNIWGNIS